MFLEKNKKICAIISEYNPFHNGHSYHIDKSRQITEADYIIVVMSGNFVQRGMPAILDKYTRTQMALTNGADLVIELPVIYSMSSAEYFAGGAVSLIDKLNYVDYLSFGSECNSIESMLSVARLLINPSTEFDNMISESIRAGLSFPKARENALKNHVNESVLSSPNNILGIEYLKALQKIGSSITPVTVRRSDNGYNNSIMTESEFNSASAIRSALYNNVDISSSVPKNTISLYHNMTSINDYNKLIFYKLNELTCDELVSYLDVSMDLACKIQKNIKDYKSIDSFIEILKSKNWTYSRISRALFHILLDIKKEDSIIEPSYARILGFKKESSELLSLLKKTSEIPLISKLADAKINYSLQKDILSSNLYYQVNDTYLNEYKQSPVII